MYLLFDGDFAKNIDVNVEFYNAILAALCAIIIVLGMGSLLIALLTVSDKLTAF
ncbi:hypothetical protein [Eggerthia catenaformis]|uniref:hypothetical protein n=1 Tax=Eggerthia catenaformis TaxID=31973 RepID=UPI0028EE5CE9|nr:hypothetical protein [Eggerthia catenaformis]